MIRLITGGGVALPSGPLPSTCARPADGDHDRGNARFEPLSNIARIA